MSESQVPRITGLLVIEVRDSNPNRRPDNAGFPRQRPDGRGEISPVSIKRKLRELVAEKDGLVWTTAKKRFGIRATNRSISWKHGTGTGRRSLPRCRWQV